MSKLNGNGANGSAHGVSEIQAARTQAVLKRFYTESGWQPVENKTPLSVLIDGEVEQGEGGPLGLEMWGARHEALNALFDYLCEDGVDPRAVVKRIYSVGKALNRPPWSLMTCEQIGDLFNQERATVSARGKRIYTDYLKKRGFRGCKSPYQKDEDAVESYAVAQKGNQNRLGTRRAKKRSKPNPTKKP